MEDKQWKYHVQFKREAVKGQDGFKVDAYGDEYPAALQDATSMYIAAILQVTPAPVEEKK